MTKLKKYDLAPVQVGEFTVWMTATDPHRAQDHAVVVPILIGDEYDLTPLADREIKTVVDIGSNVGAFTMRAKSLWPDCKVIAGEPNPHMNTAFKLNTEKLTDVHLYEVAVLGDRRTNETTLHITGQEDGDGSHFASTYVLDVVNRLDPSWVAERQFKDHEFTVPCKCILDMFSESGVDEIDILKIDAEGPEAEILEALESSGWLKKIKWIRGEWHHVDAIARIQKALEPTHIYHLGSHGPAWGSLIAHRRWDV